MKKPSDIDLQRESMRQKIIGLGEKSLRKSYYPQLRVRLAELERFRALLDQSSDAVMLLEPEGLVIIDLNETAAALMGRGRATLVGAGLLDLVRMEDQGPILCLAGRVPPCPDDTVRGVACFGPSAAQPTTVEFTARLALLAERRYIVFAGRDISRRLRAEREKEELQAQLVQAQKLEAVGTMAGGIAHDFNNILTGIMGFAELARMAAEKGRATPAELDHILSAAQRGKAMISQLLSFSRKAGPDLRPLDLNAVIGEAVPLIRRNLPEAISLEVDPGPGLSPVMGDANQLSNVLLNLATNARDAMPDGGVLRLATANEPLSGPGETSLLGLAPGDYVRLLVSDSGTGIDPVTLSRIFEPFFTTKKQGRGTGLGLASAQGTIAAHGGRITCRSKPGQGCTFVIHLPAASGRRREAPLGEAASARQPGGDEAILLVDDEEALRDVGSRILESKGYTVSTAASGEEALAVIQGGERPVDLVLLDLGMAGMGGMRSLERIGEIAPGTKVVIVSGSTGEDRLGSLRRAGAAGFLPKPFSMGDLLWTVRGVLDGNGPAFRKR